MIYNILSKPTNSTNAKEFKESRLKIPDNIKSKAKKIEVKDKKLKNNSRFSVVKIFNNTKNEKLNFKLLKQKLQIDYDDILFLGNSEILFNFKNKEAINVSFAPDITIIIDNQFTSFLPINNKLNYEKEDINLLYCSWHITGINVDSLLKYLLQDTKKYNIIQYDQDNDTLVIYSQFIGNFQNKKYQGIMKYIYSYRNHTINIKVQPINNEKINIGLNVQELSLYSSGFISGIEYTLSETKSLIFILDIFENKFKIFLVKDGIIKQQIY